MTKEGVMTPEKRSGREEFHRLAWQLYGITRLHPMSEVLRGLEEVLLDATQQREVDRTDHVDEVLLKLRQARDAVWALERDCVTKGEAANHDGAS